jgi:hypothetical protein
MTIAQIEESLNAFDAVIIAQGTTIDSNVALSELLRSEIAYIKHRVKLIEIFLEMPAIEETITQII